MSFAARIRERFPEGLTGVLAIGGTRTTYILERNRHQANPGSIGEFADYANFALDRLYDVITAFFELGGQNLIVTLFTWQGFYERGAEYAERASRFSLSVLDEQRVKFYETQQIDPYFTGIDTLLHLPEDRFEHEIGVQFADFQRNWGYQEGRRKIIYEISPIPLFSIFNAHLTMGAEAYTELERKLATCTDLETMNDLLYRYYSRAIYGTEVPPPHFYLGANRNGDLKLRSIMPIALLCGGHFRLYYTPYPSLFITRETLQEILENLAFDKPFRSTEIDYSGQLSPELLQAEYQRVLTLRADPETTLGMSRHLSADNDD